jgi:hypothetical protein
MSRDRSPRVMTGPGPLRRLQRPTLAAPSVLDAVASGRTEGDAGA